MKFYKRFNDFKKDLNRWMRGEYWCISVFRKLFTHLIGYCFWVIINHVILQIYVIFINYYYNLQQKNFFQISSPLNFPPPLVGTGFKIRYFFFKNLNSVRLGLNKWPNLAVNGKVLICFIIVFRTFINKYQRISMF